jgi:deoxyribodipyrimidine photo-lyase
MQKGNHILNSKNINIVWLKRDLRLQDHEPLHKVEQAGIPYIIIYLFEPNVIEYPDTSPRHLQFVYHSIKSLNKRLKSYNRFVDTFYGEAIDIFNFLNKNYNIQQLFSYQESGTKTTWQRDKQINNFCIENNIIWKQSQRDGIIRGLKNRDTWNTHWHATMHSPIIKNNYSISELNTLEHSYVLPQELVSKLENYPKQFQPAGEENAWRYLKSFAQKRGFNYHRHISKPTESRIACKISTPFEFR